MPIDGLPGDNFSGCVKTMSGKIDNPEAFCAWKIHELTGNWPSEESLSEAGKRYTYNGITCTSTQRRSSDRDDKAWQRTVTYQGDTKTVHYADPDMPMRRNNDDARKAFLSRHNCDSKKDPFAPGFWACYDWANPSEESMTESLLHESLCTLDITEAKINEETGGLSGTIIIEGLSANGRNYYTPEALQTIPEVFANAPIYIDHQTSEEQQKRPERSLQDLVGRLPDADNFYFEADNGKQTCKFKGAIITDDPAYIKERIKKGIWRDMSISAQGEGEQKDDGKFYVQRFIKSAFTSHDLVTVGAAGGKAILNESMEVNSMDGIEKRLDELKGLTLSEALAKAKIPTEYHEAIKFMIEEMNMDKEEKPAEEQESPEEEPVSEQVEVPELVAQLPEAMQSVWASAYEQAMGEELPPEDCVHMAWLAVVQAMMQSEPAEEQEEKPAEEKPAQESLLIAGVVAGFKEALSQMTGKVSKLGMSESAEDSEPETDALTEAMQKWMK